MPAAAAFPDRIAHAWASAPEVGATYRDATLVERAPRICTFEIVTGRAGFDALETEWNDLFWRAGHSAQVFQTSIGTGTGATTTSPHPPASSPHHSLSSPVAATDASS